jgi:Tol biopolymer transport system component
MARKRITVEDLWKVERVATPTLSPDGAQACVSVSAYDMGDNKARASLWILSAFGGEPRRLTSAGEKDGEPRWSPDGKWIAFSRDRGYAGGVVIIGADGTGERALTDKGGWPVWWPDNQHIGYRIVAPDGNQQILVAPLDGGPSVPIDALKFSGTNEPFDLFRDGRRLTSSNAQHVSDEIWIIRQ